MPAAAGPDPVIRTPDQRVRVFISSTLAELAAERHAARDAVTRLRLVPVMFELGARPHPPREVYRAYLAQSQVFVGIYWQSYGWVAPGEEISGLEDEYRLSAVMPRLIYVKSPAPDREPRLTELLARIKSDDSVSYQRFSSPAELQRLVEDDLAVLLSERFEMTRPRDSAPAPIVQALPAPATPLIDREQETAAVEDMVVRQGARLITLTGPGGVGKSRLALAAAARLASGFPDGVRFVDLASVSAAELVPGTIAAALGLNTSGGKLVEDLKSYLRAKRLLLVLDKARPEYSRRLSSALSSARQNSPPAPRSRRDHGGHARAGGSPARSAAPVSRTIPPAHRSGMDWSCEPNPGPGRCRHRKDPVVLREDRDKGSAGRRGMGHGESAGGPVGGLWPGPGRSLSLLAGWPVNLRILGHLQRLADLLLGEQFMRMHVP
jgi:Domain of unknown function (DUF4062)